MAKKRLGISATSYQLDTLFQLTSGEDYTADMGNQMEARSAFIATILGTMVGTGILTGGNVTNTSTNNISINAGYFGIPNFNSGGIEIPGMFYCPSATLSCNNNDVVVARLIVNQGQGSTIISGTYINVQPTNVNAQTDVTLATYASSTFTFTAIPNLAQAILGKFVSQVSAPNAVFQNGMTTSKNTYPATGRPAINSSSGATLADLVPPAPNLQGSYAWDGGWGSLAGNTFTNAGVISTTGTITTLAPNFALFASNSLASSITTAIANKTPIRFTYKYYFVWNADLSSTQGYSVTLNWIQFLIGIYGISVSASNVFVENTTSTNVEKTLAEFQPTPNLSISNSGCSVAFNTSLALVATTWNSVGNTSGQSLSFDVTYFYNGN